MSWQKFRAKGPALGVRRSCPDRLLAAVGLAAGALTLPASPAYAATIPIGCSVPDLIAAIRTANNTPGADTLRLTAGCTYELVAPDNDNPANGLPAITSDITIDGNGATIKRAGSAPAFRVLFVAGMGILTLNRTTISGGEARDCPGVPLPPGSVCGGGIENLGPMRVNHSRVTGNTATSNVLAAGGGIASIGPATLNDTLVRGNTAAYAGTTMSGVATGGGIANNGPLTVDGSRVLDNRVAATPGTNSLAEAAGISSFAQATIKNTVVDGNMATARGGTARGALVNNSPITMTVTDTTISDNTTNAPEGLVTGGAASTNRTISLTRTFIFGNHAIADGGTARGGGVSVGPAGVITVKASRVRGNTVSASGGSAGGGGLANALGGTLTVEQTWISGNTASARGGTAQGGGLFNALGSTALNGSSVIGNKAGDGGGIFKESGTVTLNNTLVKGNRPNNCAPPGSVPGCTEAPPPRDVRVRARQHEQEQEQG
jgi:hypothetical protein